MINVRHHSILKLIIIDHSRFKFHFVILCIFASLTHDFLYYIVNYIWHFKRFFFIFSIDPVKFTSDDSPSQFLQECVSFHGGDIFPGIRPVSNWTNAIKLPLVNKCFVFQ
eukprot:NODE_66_length_25735_cov_0.318497.p25 type:complete len:110 gc:universal NODE_66_length_25735_cov_0.318497:15203-15532(+)